MSPSAERRSIVNPVVLYDDEDGPNDFAWVEACCTEEEARDALAEHLCDEAGNTPARAVEPARRVWLRPKDDDSLEFERCEAGDDGLEFFEFDVTTAEAVSDAER